MCIIVAWLSSNKIAITFRSSNAMSRNWSAGNPSRRTDAFAATISASGVLCETHVCFLETPFKGNKVFGPVRAINIMLKILTILCRQRSLRRCIEIKPACQRNLPCGHLRVNPKKNLHSRSICAICHNSHSIWYVTFFARLATALGRSNLAIPAPCIIFIAGCNRL